MAKSISDQSAGLAQMLSNPAELWDWFFIGGGFFIIIHATILTIEKTFP